MFPDMTLRQQADDLLHEYGQEQHEKEIDRVHLAILRLAGNSAEQIMNWVLIAKHDYRDVLASAEYPTQMRTNSWKLSKADQQRIESEDHEQYELRNFYPQFHGNQYRLQE